MTAVKVDQVVRRVGEEGMALQGARPLRRRIGPRDELRRDLAGGAPSGLIERIEILAHRPAGPGKIVPVDGLRSFRRALLVRIGPDQAGINREALASDEPFVDAALDGGLEQLAQEIAVPEAAVPVLRERRVVWDRSLQAEPAEPAIGEVEVDLVAEPALGPDPEADIHLSS